MGDTVIPTVVLARTDLRRALREHDFAAAFRILQQHTGMSQARIGAACGLTQGKVSLIMGGSTLVTSFDVMARIADGLRIPGELIQLSPRPWEVARPPSVASPQDPPRPGAETSWQGDATITMAHQLAGSDLMMDRRALTRALTATAVTGAALLEPLEGWLLPRTDNGQTSGRRPGQVGLQEVEQLERTAVAVRSWDHQYGGGLRRKAVIGQLAEVSALLDEHQAPGVEQRLYRVLAQLAGTAATMAWDSGLQRGAQNYYRLSLRAAHEGRDWVWGANVLAGMARQMLCTGRPHDALDLVRLAQDGARGAPGPRVRAMLASRQAWAYACLGRLTAFRRATDQAHAALAEASVGEEPYWIAYFDEAELAGVTGGRLLELARDNPRTHAESAAEQIRRALATRPPGAGRSTALDRIGLAETAFFLGDLATARHEAHAAVDAAQMVQSDRVRSGLARLYSYTVGHGASRGVREVRDRIRQQLAR